MYKIALTVELVPKTCWYSNVRSEVSAAQWDKLRRAVYKAAGHKCEICGGRGPKHPVDCHEVWRYDDQRHIQTLERMIALCPACHDVKHMGLRGSPEAVRHLAKVNNWCQEEVSSYLEGVWEVWFQRSRHPWKLDSSGLALYGISVPGASPG